MAVRAAVVHLPSYTRRSLQDSQAAVVCGADLLPQANTRVSHQPHTSESTEASYHAWGPFLQAASVYASLQRYAQCLVGTAAAGIATPMVMRALSV